MLAAIENQERLTLTCKHCGVGYKNKASLKKHISILHRNEQKQAKEMDRPFQCECGDRFPRKPDLKYH